MGSKGGLRLSKKGRERKGRPLPFISNKGKKEKKAMGKTRGKGEKTKKKSLSEGDLRLKKVIS